MIFSNLAISLDGKIATADRSYFPLGTALDRKIMRQLRSKADALLMGASTLRTFKKPCLALPAHQSPVNVVLSHNLSGIDPRWSFFSSRSIQRILYVTNKLTSQKLRVFESTSTVVSIPRSSLNKKTLARWMIEDLKKRGLHDLLLEGGGELMWEFTQDHLIDEYHITLTPRILGGQNAPTWVGGVGFIPGQDVKLRIKSMRRVGDEIYLIYGRR